jgi:VanZ family protein
MPSKALTGLLVDIGIPHNDKVVHFLMYGVLAILLLWALEVKKMHCALVLGIVLGCFAYGALMEVLQLVAIVGHREFSWADMVANGLGAVVAVVLYPMIARPKASI